MSGRGACGLRHPRLIGQRTTTRPRATEGPSGASRRSTPSDYPRCGKVIRRLITGDFAFVTLLRKDPAHDFEAEIVSGIDLGQGAKARWHHIAAPCAWCCPTTCGRAAAPGCPTVAPSRTDACDIAATETAIYELGNPRCTWGSPEGDGGAEIRRVVRPVFRPIDDE